MALEALSTSELLNFIIYDTLSATPFTYSNDSFDTNNLLLENGLKPQHHLNVGGLDSSCAVSPQMQQQYHSVEPENHPKRQNLTVQGGRKKRRRKPKVCKNKEEAETQRMTHIAVERNRRKQMNEHLAVLRSLMPESYVQRGDQASIVGGAIEYVKELEHILQSLEAKKFPILQQGGNEGGASKDSTGTSSGGYGGGYGGGETMKFLGATPFAQFFAYPQYTCSHEYPNKYTSKSKAAIADIEVTLIETHANIRILSRRRVRQLTKMVAAFQTLYMSILHLNVTTLDPLVLYSISAKVEEGCQFSSADDIAGAVHHILRIIEEEANTSLCCQS